MLLQSKKKKKVPRGLLYKISSKLKEVQRNFEDKTSFNIKMSKSELTNSALEYENNGTEESETWDDEYLSNFAKLQLHMYEPSVSKDSKKDNCPGKESSDSKEERLVGLEILSGFLVVSANQWLLMWKAFAAWISMKLMRVISKKYFYLFLKYFYPVIYW